MTGAALQVELVIQLVLVKVGLCLTKKPDTARICYPIVRKVAAYLYMAGCKGDGKGWQGVLWPLLALLYSLLQERRQRLDMHKQRDLQEIRIGA